MRNQNESVEALNDRLAVEHPIDAYYESSPLPIRLIERKRLEIIREMIGRADAQDLAEIGSGGGHVLRMFPRARITAIDVSDVFLDTARKNLAGYDARFLKGEIDKMDLPASSFDRIICTEVLEHTEDPRAILSAIKRLLRPDGVAAITVPNDPLINGLKDFVQRTPVGWVLGSRIQWGGDKYHLHQWTPGEFAKLLSKYFHITHKAAAPSDHLPIRACFRCVHRD